MFENKILVFKSLPVDRSTTGSVVPRKVAALNHKVRDDPMKLGTSVSIQSLLLFVIEPFTQFTKVFGRLGDFSIVQFELDLTEVLAICRNFEEDVAEFDWVILVIQVGGGGGGRPSTADDDPMDLGRAARLDRPDHHSL